MTQLQLNDLLRSKIDKFSLDMLIDLATHAEISVLAAGDPHHDFSAD